MVLLGLTVHSRCTSGIYMAATTPLNERRHIKPEMLSVGHVLKHPAKLMVSMLQTEVRPWLSTNAWHTQAQRLEDMLNHPI